MAKRGLLVFVFVAVLALVILYIGNEGSVPARPVPQLPTSPTPQVTSPVLSKATKPDLPPPFGVPILGRASDQLVRMVPPRYTKAALNAHYEGLVKVNFILGTDGRAHSIKIVNSPGYGMDQNIIEAMKEWFWDAFMFHEDQKLTITFVFKLEY